MNSVEDILKEWTRKHLSVFKPELDPLASRQAANMDRVTSELDAGNAVVAVKPFKAEGAQYRVGDVVKPGIPNLRRLAAHGYLTTQDEWDKSGKYSFYKDYSRRVLDPLASLLRGARSEEGRAKLLVTAATAALAAAQVKLNDISALRAGYERELELALDRAPEFTDRA